MFSRNTAATGLTTSLIMRTIASDFLARKVSLQHQISFVRGCDFAKHGPILDASVDEEAHPIKVGEKLEVSRGGRVAIRSLRFLDLRLGKSILNAVTELSGQRLCRAS